MIQLPDGFNASALFTELLQVAAPFAGIALLVACGFLITKMLKKAP
jgi:hypothetical protein